jgi:hypothetical protein
MINIDQHCAQTSTHIVDPAVREPTVALLDGRIHAAVARHVRRRPHAVQMELHPHALLRRATRLDGLQLFLYEFNQRSVLGQGGQVAGLQGVGSQVVEAQRGRLAGLLVLLNINVSNADKWQLSCNHFMNHIIQPQGKRTSQT